MDHPIRSTHPALLWEGRLRFLSRSYNKGASMPVWFTTLGRRACKPAPLGQPGAAHVLTATVVALTLLGGQGRPPDRSEVASADADAQTQVGIGEARTARRTVAQDHECLGSRFHRTVYRPSIQTPVLNRLAHVAGFDLGNVGEVRHRSSDLEHPVIRVERLKRGMASALLNCHCSVLRRDRGSVSDSRWYPAARPFERFRSNQIHARSPRRLPCCDMRV